MNCSRKLDRKRSQRKINPRITRIRSPTRRRMESLYRTSTVGSVVGTLTLAR